MQQSRPAVEEGACGEKTGERKEDDAVNGGHRDTLSINRGSESPPASAREEQLFLNNVEQGRLALFKSGTSSHRQTIDSSGRGENSSGESYTREM